MLYFKAAKIFKKKKEKKKKKETNIHKVDWGINSEATDWIFY